MTYTLVATNNGALELDEVVISDRLPVEVLYSGYEIAGDAGTCVLTSAEVPQLVTCSLDASSPSAPPPRPSHSS